MSLGLHILQFYNIVQLRTICVNEQNEFFLKNWNNLTKLRQIYDNKNELFEMQ